MENLTENDLINCFEEIIGFWNSEIEENEVKADTISFEGSFQENQVLTYDKGFVVKMKEEEFYITVQKH